MHPPPKQDSSKFTTYAKRDLSNFTTRTISRIGFTTQLCPQYVCSLIHSGTFAVIQRVYYTFRLHATSGRPSSIRTRMILQPGRVITSIIIYLLDASRRLLPGNPRDSASQNSHLAVFTARSRNRAAFVSPGTCVPGHVL